MESPVKKKRRGGYNFEESDRPVFKRQLDSPPVKRFMDDVDESSDEDLYQPLRVKGDKREDFVDEETFGR
jgi:hypothetical protein